MSSKIVCVTVVAWLATIAARPARANDLDDDGRPPIWPIAGALTALVPLCAGGALWSEDDRPSRQRLGADLILAGFAAGPWVAHVRSGRPRRALAFGLASLATSASAFAATEVTDPFDPTLANHRRVPFGVLLTASLFAAAAGIFDGFWLAPDRDGAP